MDRACRPIELPYLPRRSAIEERKGGNQKSRRRTARAFDISARRRRGTREIRRCRKRYSRKYARSKVQRFAAFRMDAAGTSSSRAMGHPRIQPQPKARISEMAGGLLAGIGSAPNPQRLDEKHSAIPQRLQSHA